MSRTDPLRVSPSQFKRWGSCPRKSAFQWADVAGYHDPLTRATDLGTRCHAMAETWLSAGVAPDTSEPFKYHRTIKKPTEERLDGLDYIRHPETGAFEEVVTAYPGLIVSAGLHHLPAPHTPGLEVETEIQFESERSVYAMRADFLLRGPSVEVPLAGDHKFLRDLGSALGLDPEGKNSYNERNYIGDDPQFIMETFALALAEPDKPMVAGAWVDYETKPTSGRIKARKVHLDVLQSDAIARMQVLDQRGGLIQAVYRAEIDPLDLPPVASSCYAYGRVCEFAKICNLSEEQKFMSTLQGSNVDPRIAALVGDLQNGTIRPTIVGAPTSPAKPAPPPLVTAKPAPPPMPSQGNVAPSKPTPPPMPSGIVQTGVETVGHNKGAQRSGVFRSDVIGSPETAGAAGTVHGLPKDVWAGLTAEQQEQVIRASLGAMQGPDVVNPPEAPENDGHEGPAAPAKRVEHVIIPAGGYPAMDRTALKALAIERGLCDSGYRKGGPDLIKLLEDAAGTSPKAVALNDGDAAIREALDLLGKAVDALHRALGL